MFDKEIEFSTHEDYFSLREDYPIPAKLNIPEWYKKLNHTVTYKTVKGCMPFLDSLVSGYILKIPQDLYIKHNVPNKDNQENKDSLFISSMKDQSQYLIAKSLNLNSFSDVHPTKQLENSPLLEKNKNLPFYKIVNPWKIKTPKGYSCLFVPPLNNSDDRFSIIPGIVDTDTFTNEVNFPIVINGDKYPVLETLIKKETNNIKLIPKKRNTWKIKFKSITQKEAQNQKIFLNLKLINVYKDKFWKKKSWN